MIYGKRMTNKDDLQKNKVNDTSSSDRTTTQESDDSPVEKGPFPSEADFGTSGAVNPESELTLGGKKKKEKKPSVPSTGPGCFSRIFGIFGIFITVVVIVGFILALKTSVLFLPIQEASQEIVVSIPAGATVPRIGELLEEAGAIRSAWAFVWTVRAKSRLDEKPVLLKAGEMSLDPSLPVWGVMNLLTKGNYKLYPFTVPEGRNMFEIAQMIEKAKLGKAQDFLALCRDPNFIELLGLKTETLEGYLYPETYNFPKGTPLQTIIKTMTDSFWSVWPKYDALARKIGLSRHEVITLASIVEKETGAAPERPMIAGVFFNRLAKGMRLQTDPTVVYGVEDYKGTITRKHLQTKHPYNTYIITGLPPGPIANPGEAAIEAVVKPDIVPYIYFVSRNDGSGTHDFSKTLSEHNRKVRRYLR